MDGSHDHASVAVHHEVKAGGTPAGSVTLIGGSDTIINTKRLDGGGHSWSVEMAKDDIETKERPFTLEIVPVGANAEEDDLTSCVVRDGSTKNPGAAVRMDRVKLSRRAWRWQRCRKPSARRARTRSTKSFRRASRR
jgi:hypothetical protein